MASKRDHEEAYRAAPANGAASPTNGRTAPGPPDDAAQQRSGRERVEQAIDLLYRRRWIALLAFLIVVAVVAAYVLVREPVYQARSIVRVELSMPLPNKDEAAAPVGGSDPFATNERSLSAELFFLQTSDAIHEQVQQRLQEMQAQTPGETGFSPREHVQFGVADNAASAISMIGTSGDPEEAALLANLYAEEYVQLIRQASRAHLTATRELLEKQETRRRETLSQADARVEAFERREGAVELDQETKILASQIASLEVQRDEARLELQTRRAGLESLKEELASLDAQLTTRIASDAERRLQTLHEDIAALRAGKEQTEQRYPNPEDRDERVRERLRQLDERIGAAEAEADRLAQQLVDQGSAVVGGTGAEPALARAAGLRREVQQEQAAIGTLENRLQDIEARLTRYNAKLRTIPEQSRELAQLERARQRAEQALQSVAGRLQETSIAEESQPGYAHLLRRATVPEEPVNAGPASILLLGVFFGLSLGLGLALLRDKLDKRLYKPEHLRDQGHHVIVTIPNMQPLIEEDHKGEAFIEQDGQRFATSLVTLLNPMSSVAEAYRHLRTKIQYGRSGKPTQVLLVTSPGAGEGKSTLAANLAIASAQAGRRTLLIDADLRRPQVHKLLGLEQDRQGLVELLYGQPGFDFEAAATAIDGVYALPAWDLQAHAAEVASNPVGLLESPQLKERLAEMRGQFDAIIFDTPPLLVATDAAALSTQCDATLVVARAGKTKEDELSYAVEALKEVGANIAGVVLNAFDLSMAYGHKYKYQHYTKYGPYSKYGYYAHQTSRGRLFQQRAK